MDKLMEQMSGESRIRAGQEATGASRHFPVANLRVSPGSGGLAPALRSHVVPNPSDIRLPPSLADVLTSRGRVLVVDDDPGLLEFSQRLLRGAGYVVSGVISGARCRAALAVAKPDLILLD